MQINKDTVLGVGITAVIGLLVALVWNLLSTGVEGTIAANPKIVSLETKMTTLQSDFDDYVLASTSIHASATAQRQAIIDNQNRILDALIAN